MKQRSKRSKGAQRDAQPEETSCEILALVVDDLLGKDHEYRRHSRRLLRLQGRLKGRASPRAWRAYLRIEETANDRLARAVDLVAVRVAALVLRVLRDPDGTP